MRSLCVKLLMLTLILFSASLFAAIDEADPYFPLEKGNFWVYRGETKWTEQNEKTGKNEVKNATVTGRMEVLDTVAQGLVFAAKIKGLPHDFSGYEPGMKPGNHLIVRVGTAQYHLFSGETAEEVWKKIKADDLYGIVTEGSLFLDAPLVEGKIFGEFATTPSGRYCYVVEGGWPFSASNLKGPKVRKGTKEFEVWYRTSPSRSVFRFAPGVGIVGYQYVHHGTVAETDLTLIEYGKGKPARSR